MSVCVCVWSHTSQGPLGLLGESIPTERGEKVFAVFVSRLAESPMGLYCKAIISGGVRDLLLVTEESERVLAVTLGNKCLCREHLGCTAYARVGVYVYVCVRATESERARARG